MWEKTLELLGDEVISPFVYGRHYQIVIDLSTWNLESDRRFKILDIVKSKSPLEIVCEARRICLKIMENIIKKDKRDNGLYDLMFDPYKSHTNFYNDSLFYSGRCFQFLLDTDRKKFNQSELAELTIPKIIQKAHKVKNELLARQSSPYEINCGCTCCKTCGWSYGNNRCDCGNRKVYYSFGELNTLDDVYPIGYVDLD